LVISVAFMPDKMAAWGLGAMMGLGAVMGLGAMMVGLRTTGATWGLGAMMVGLDTAAAGGAGKGAMRSFVVSPEGDGRTASVVRGKLDVEEDAAG
jgi:hypothetical protein